MNDHSLTKHCSECNTPNNPDACLCKMCGQSLTHKTNNSIPPTGRTRRIRPTKPASLRRLVFLGAIIFFGFSLLWVKLPAPDIQSAPANDRHSTGVALSLPNGSKAQCANVPYGNLELEKGQDLKELPLNELLLELENPPFVEPPNPDGPTLVEIGLFVMEVAEIEPGDNTYEMEGFLDLIWCDPRLTFNPEEAGVEKEIFLEQDAEREIERLWWPDVELVNEIKAREVENEELIIFQDGTVEYREKFEARLAADYDLRRLPFDTQTLIVEIESFAWPSEDLQFVVEEDVIGFSSEFSIPEWEIINIEEHLEEKMEVRDRAPFSELVAEFTIKRDPGFFLFKIMIPQAIIVAISWAVFWMIGDGLADRMSVSFTGVLTSVAYQFIVSENVPRHIYNTYLDVMVFLSFVMMALTIVENIVVNWLYLQENGLLADKVDRTSRWLFPGIYFSGLIILALVYLS